MRPFALGVAIGLPTAVPRSSAPAVECFLSRRQRRVAQHQRPPPHESNHMTMSPPSSGRARSNNKGRRRPSSGGPAQRPARATRPATTTPIRETPTGESLGTVSTREVPTDATFESLGVPAPIVRMLAERGVTAPFPIQAATLPDSLAGRDVLGRGRTGSGKTIAFAIPTVAALAALGQAPPAGQAPRPRPGAHP